MKTNFWIYLSTILFLKEMNNNENLNCLYLWGLCTLNNKSLIYQHNTVLQNFNSNVPYFPGVEWEDKKQKNSSR